jgi:hypothetical protein
MTYRSVAFRDLALGAAAALASVSLLGCPGGGGGGGGCPEIGGSWNVSGACTNATCEFTQDGCSITLECDDGRTLQGTVSKGTASFRDSEVSCTGEFEGLEDEDGDGDIAPGLEGSCTIEGEMCDYFAECSTGDCRIPDDDGSSDEGDSGEGGRSGQGGASGFLGGGQGGDGPAGTGGISGAGGISGQAGDTPAGNGGVGGVVSGNCGSCVQSACSSAASACQSEGECGTILECALDSGCSLDDADCVDMECEDVYATLEMPDEQDITALDDVQLCIEEQCASSCYADGPVGGTGGVGGDSGEGGVGGLPPSGGSGGSTGGGCTDTCFDAADGACDDGGPGSDFTICDLGTDCTDCGPR